MMGDLRIPLAFGVALSVFAAAAGQGAAEEAASPASDKDLQAAKDAFEAAQSAFVREQFDVAAEKFLAAFERKPYPAFLFNAAVSFEKSKQLGKAKELFERYLQADRNASD